MSRFFHTKSLLTGSPVAFSFDVANQCTAQYESGDHYLYCVKEKGHAGAHMDHAGYWDASRENIRCSWDNYDAARLYRPNVHQQLTRRGV